MGLPNNIFSSTGSSSLDGHDGHDGLQESAAAVEGPNLGAKL
jgi:hypothetical protein